MDNFVPEVDGGHGLIQHGLILYVPPKNGGLADPAVSDEDDLVLRTAEGCLLGCHSIKNDGAINIIRSYYVIRRRKGDEILFGVWVFPVG